MVSTLLELCGFGCAVTCAALAGGPEWAFGVACPCLLFMGYSAEGASFKRPAWLKRPSWPKEARDGS